MKHFSQLSLAASFISICLLVFFVMSCDKEEENFPIEPHIEFKDVKFIDVTNPDFYSPDTLKLTFDFTDGDADLGFTNELDLPAYRFYYKLNDPTPYSSYSVSNQAHQYVNYKAKRTNLNYDTLPAYERPFTCANWEIIQKNSNNISTIADTLYFQFNPDYYNMKVKFLVEQADGSFAESDLLKEFCITYDALFLNVSYGLVRIKKYSTKRGQLVYSMIGSGFKFVFGSKKVKLQVYVQDRALHKSNMMETPVFTFQ